MAASSGNGWSLQWDSDGDGILDQHTPFAGYTEYPTWLKLEREGNQFIAYYRTEQADWIRVGSATAGKTSRVLDAGMFAMGRSAGFDEFAVTPSR